MHGIFGTSHLSPDIQLTKDVLKVFALGPVISSQEVEWLRGIYSNCIHSPKKSGTPKRIQKV